MNKKELIKSYKAHQEKMAAYYMMFATLLYDKETIAPRGGSNYRNKKLSYLMGDAHNIQVNPEYINVVEQLSKLDLGEDLNRDIYLAKKQLDIETKFTSEEVMEFDYACNEAWEAWLKAKTTDNYDLFAPHLKKLIELVKIRAQKRNAKLDPYNLYLDDYEEGMNKSKYDKFFKQVKKELTPLIKKINKKEKHIDNSFLFKYYPAEKQAKFAKILCDYICYDPKWGYLTETEHPFTSDFSKYDVRITTNYDEYNIASAIFSIIHEAGHAHYGHNVDSKYDDTNIRSISSGMHESQSRFLENYIGRRKSFWVNLYPELVKLFPENLSDVSLDEFVRAINVSHSSLIRTDADELTYPMHIIIRYEIEKGIFDGSVDINKLDIIWNQKYKEYLDVEVPNNRDGILQDVHWSNTYFGYFPTYALGSAIGAQIFSKMSKDLDVDYLLEHKQFKKIVKYLKDNIQHFGALYNYEKILNNYMNEDFNAQYYIDYLKDKYKKLYDIK